MNAVLLLLRTATRKARDDRHCGLCPVMVADRGSRYTVRTYREAMRGTSRVAFTVGGGEMTVHDLRSWSYTPTEEKDQ